MDWYACGGQNNLQISVLSFTQGKENSGFNGKYLYPLSYLTRQSKISLVCSHLGCSYALPFCTSSLLGFFVLPSVMANLACTDKPGKVIGL